MSNRNKPRRNTLAIGVLLFAGFAFSPLHSAIASEPTAAEIQAQNRDEFRALVRDVYQYAYPLVLMDITRQQTTNVPDAVTTPRRAPMNQFAHYRQYPDANSKEVVRINFDTLYSMAWVDVSKEPVIFSVPEAGDRYYLAPMLDMWTDVFAVPGTRTTGNKAGNFALAAAYWKGELPKGVELVRSPTPMFWIIGRTQTNGPADYDNVHKVQDQFRLVPLSHWGHNYTPPTGLAVDPKVDNLTPPLDQVNRMTGVELLTQFAQLLKSSPPHASDYPILHRMRGLGIVPGKDFNPGAFSAAQLDVINASAKEALVDMQQAIRSGSLGKVHNGWVWSDTLGSYGSAYRTRAAVALVGLGANLPEDAIYPNSFTDSDGNPLSGKNAYVLRFEKDQLPPVGAFWSLTLYDKEGFQVANPINRFALGSYDSLKREADGSLEIHIQHASPGTDQNANWLPAPDDNFQVMLRMYSPQAAVTNGKWQPPAIRKIN